MGKRSDMPKPKAIIDFWADRLVDIDIEEFALTWESCFVCGAVSKLERSHILSLCDGGTNTVDNLHLLCRQCHDESEPLSGEAYWRWYKQKRNTFFVHPLVRMHQRIDAVMSPYIDVKELYAELSQLKHHDEIFFHAWAAIDKGYKQMRIESDGDISNLPNPTDAELSKMYRRAYDR
jgi:hypothetical protein